MLRFLNHKDPVVWLLTEDSIHEPPEPLSCAKYGEGHCGIQYNVVSTHLKMADTHGKAFKPFTPPPCWKFLRGLNLDWENHGKVSVAVTVM